MNVRDWTPPDPAEYTPNPDAWTAPHQAVLQQYADAKYDEEVAQLPDIDEQEEHDFWFPLHNRGYSGDEVSL